MKRINSLKILVDELGFPASKRHQRALLSNRNISWEDTLEMVRNGIIQRKRLKYFSGNPNITIDIIKENSDINWHISSYSKSPEITLDDFNRNATISFNPCGVSKNPNVTLDIIENTKNCDWCDSCLSINQNVTPKYVFSHADKNWEIPVLLGNPNFSEEVIDIMLKFKQIDMKYIHLNESLRIEYILLLVEKGLESVAEKGSLPFRTYEAGFDFKGIMCHPNMTIVKMKEFDCSAQHLSYAGGNPNLTWNLILDCLRCGIKMSYYDIYSNVFANCPAWNRGKVDDKGNYPWQFIPPKWKHEVIYAYLVCKENNLDIYLFDIIVEQLFS